MLLLLAACSSRIDKPLDEVDSDALCRILQGEVDAEIFALPAGSNGPEAFAPDTHQSIQLTDQNDGFYTGTVGYSVPAAGSYFLAFSEPTSLLVRPEFAEPFEGTPLRSSCAEVTDLFSVDFEAERVSLQISDVPQPVISFATSLHL